MASQATIQFTPPDNTGGIPITAYTVTSYPDNIRVAGPQSPIVVTGLTNGTSYTFTVHATNANGDSVESIESNAFTPNWPTVPLQFWSQSTMLYQDVVTNVPLNYGAQTITLFQDVVTDVPLVFN